MAVTSDNERVLRAPKEAAYPNSGYANYVLGVLVLVYAFAFIDRQILNLLVGPIRRDLQISDTEISLLSGFGFALFYAIFGIPLARIADSGSRRGLIAIGFAMWSLFTAGCGLARNFAQLFLMRVGVGVGEASLSPAAYSLITDYFPPERRSTAQGIYATGIFIGGGIALAVGGTVIGWAETRPEWTLPFVGTIRSWQLVFLIVGLPGVALSLIMFTIAEPRRRGPGAGTKSVPVREVFAFIKGNIATVTCHNLGAAMLFFSLYGTGAWGPTYFIRYFDWSPAFTGQVYGLTAAVSGALGVICGGMFADHLAKRGYQDAHMRVALIGTLCWFPTGVAYLLVPDPALAIALLAPTLFFAVMPYGVAPAALMEFTPAPMRSQMGALYLFVGNLIGLGIGPTAVALLTDFVFQDDNRVGSSLLVVTVGAHVLAALAFGLGLKPFVRSKERVREWRAAARS
jgi:MFS family permease